MSWISNINSEEGLHEESRKFPNLELFLENFVNNEIGAQKEYTRVFDEDQFLGQ